MTSTAVPIEQEHGLRRWFWLFFCGLCMGAADIVPGISGGTIAFIMGFYAELLNSIKSLNRQAIVDLLRCRFSSFQKRVNWRFLLPLGAGIAASFLLLARLVQYLLFHETYRTLLYALFLGLIIASITFCIRKVRQWRFQHIIALFIGGAIAYLLTGTSLSIAPEEPLYDIPTAQSWHSDKIANNYRLEDGALINIPQSTVAAMVAKQIITTDTLIYSKQEDRYIPVSDAITTTKQPWIDGWIILYGMIAVTAMLLPGISGSYLLTILGTYTIAISAIADLSHALQRGTIDTDACLFLCNMGLGIAFGALCFARVIASLLQRHEQVTIALMTGFVIGALRSVWPFWSYQYALNPLHIERGPELQLHAPILPDPSTALFWLALSASVLGAAIVIITTAKDKLPQSPQRTQRGANIYEDKDL